MWQSSCYLSVCIWFQECAHSLCTHNSDRLLYNNFSISVQFFPPNGPSFFCHHHSQSILAESRYLRLLEWPQKKMFHFTTPPCSFADHSRIVTVCDSRLVILKALMIISSGWWCRFQCLSVDKVTLKRTTDIHFRVAWQTRPRTPTQHTCNRHRMWVLHWLSAIRAAVTLMIRAKGAIG